ncbi:MAG: carboxypeptidase-like regulatory domain-containing protein, partial [Bacteroidetes bacterium]|nr:carboxypeptidase-like regulatory domain-containing protein [Bacteroidota bacterium]
MQILKIISFTIIFCSSLTAQSLRGKIVDSRTNEPLKSANVLILSAKIGTASDKNGDFLIELGAIPTFQYEVKFSFLGYESKILKLDKSSLKDFYNIRLDETIL